MRPKLGRLIIALAGIVLGQAILYGPSLVGRKILLPLDLLAAPDIYLPRTAETAKVESTDPIRMDLLYYFEPARRFAAEELHAGRLPIWFPYHYAGAPFMWARFSPFMGLESCTASPVVLAWAQLLTALVAGLGAYAFFRSSLALGFWPAAICSWSYPLTGFFVFWQGFATGMAVNWLPWMFLAVDKTVRRPSTVAKKFRCEDAGRIPSPPLEERARERRPYVSKSLCHHTSALAPLGLGVATALTLVSGHLDVAGQVLLASGLYALWCLAEVWRENRSLRRAAVGLVAGWTLGFLLAAPYVLPVLDYARTGSRLARRGAGEEERPPVGLAALPEVVLPDIYGSTEHGSCPLFPKKQLNLQESSAGAYTGVVAALFAAPLAFFSRRHRHLNWFFVLSAALGLSWCLNVPGIVQLLRLPGLNLMSHNRFAFLTAFALLSLAAIGLDVLARQAVEWSRRLWLPVLLLLGMCLWCGYRVSVPPEPINSRLEQAVLEGQKVLWAQDLDGVRQIQFWFAKRYAGAACLCGLGVAFGWLLWSRVSWQSRLFPFVGAVMIGDLLWFAYGRSAQCDPALYFPPVPILEQIAKSTPGRIIGFDCYPAILPSLCHLDDIRGYDAVDPARIVQLEQLVADPRSDVGSYALTQWLIPQTTPTPDGGIRLPPILDMLNVRYVIYRGTPPPEMHPAFQGPDYWVMTNSAVLPRAYVPHRVEVVADDHERLQKLASPQFAPREVAYVESPLSLPASCLGRAEVHPEIPTRFKVSAQMETAGLMVLSDRWDDGWRARLNGKPVPILRVNHAISGVVLPAGGSTLEFRYEPASFAWGLRLFFVGIAVMLAGLGFVYIQARGPSRAGSASE